MRRQLGLAEAGDELMAAVAAAEIVEALNFPGSDPMNSEQRLLLNDATRMSSYRPYSTVNRLVRPRPSPPGCPPAASATAQQ